MDAIKNFVKGKDDQESNSNPVKPSGQYPNPSDFSEKHPQSGAVGVQHSMPDQPISLGQQGQYGFETYKAAGKLLGTKVLITGGDSGIGRSAAVMMAMEGADIGIVYLPEEEKDAQHTATLIERYGRKCLLIPQDIRSEAGCAAIVTNFVKTFGQIDTLVNNASVMYNQDSILDITTEQFTRTIETNIYGTFFLTKAALPHIPKGGSIITTSSQVAFSGPPTLVDYAMTKGAQVAFTRCLAKQLADKGIRANAVCPGPVWTPLQEAAMDKKTLEQWHEKVTPLGRIGQPAELGPTYVFLASKDASFINGQMIHVNGGACLA